MKKIFPLLLILPAIAIYKICHVFDWKLILCYFALISCFTYGYYWRDKRKARHHGQRTPEASLHVLELLGGWPAAFLAQQKLHHKTQKKSYRITYWLIVGVHQFIAFEYILNGQITPRILPT